MKTLQVAEPDHAGMKSHDSGKSVHAAHFEIMLDPNTGAITRLVTKGSGRSWASTDHPFSSLYLLDAHAGRLQGFP